MFIGGADKKSACTVNQNGKKFTVTVPNKAEYGSNFVIDVKYSAKVNNTAALAGSGNVNKANFTYDKKDPGTTTPDPTPDPTFPSENEKTTTTYVYALGILKVDPQGNALKGAEFSIFNGNNKLFAKATDTPGVYEYCAEGTTGAVQQFKTSDAGILVIKGVAAGTYQAKEMVAPEGYNVLNGTTDITATLKGQYTTKITTYKDEAGKVTSTVTENKTETETGSNVSGIVVVNNKGSQLPSTGGMETMLLYALGELLVVGTSIMLVVKKRMKRAEQ